MENLSPNPAPDKPQAEPHSEPTSETPVSPENSAPEVEIPAAPAQPVAEAGSEKAASSFQEWLALPGKIRTLIPQAKNNLKLLQSNLVVYRLAMLRYVYHAANIDSEIWNEHRWIFDEIVRLNKKTKNKLTLRLRGIRQLRQLYQEWQSVIAREDKLFIEIEKAPVSFDFYNKMMVSKESLHRTRRETEEYTQRFAKARQGLESALEYADKIDREGSLNVFGASALRLEDARAFWNERLARLHDLEAQQADAEFIINELESLKKIIYETPAMAKWIHEVEQRFTRLSYDHDLLVNSFGKAVVPDTEFSEMREMIAELIPRLWATGQREQLEHYIKTIEGFLNIYEPEVQSEISFADRHHLRKRIDQQHVEEGKNLQQLLDLTKLLISAVEAREPHMVNHSLSVARLSVATARQMNWQDEEVRFLEMAALLHDVGKIWVPESILTKEGQLTEEDVHELKKHTPYAAQILESFDSFKDIIPWIYYHHERWDGKGYPEGLVAEDIPLAARIIAVAEAYNAMISGSATRKPMSPDAAMMQVEEEAGKAFDPIVVDAFLQALNAKK